MATPPGSVGALPDPAQLARERDLYRKLLDLGARTEIEALLSEALALIVEISATRRGYLEIHDERATQVSVGETSKPSTTAGTPRLWMASGFAEGDLEEVRSAFSQGVIAEAIATRRTIVATSALDDPRFRDRESVKKNQIEAVLCAPIGADPPFGVLYLQGRLLRGPFTEEDRLRAETFARHVAALADRLLVRRRRATESDPTQPYRAALRAAGIVGRSPAIARVLQEVALVAPRDVTVLLTGASGTGKTQIARLIHDSGPRAGEPFVELNCAAFPDNLLESELFGAEKGAHSQAARKTEGKIAAAEKGTLLLDEVGELSPSAQAKLLQLLQSKEYFPLGSTRARRADVRVVAATNKDLKAAVARREFREDLFYRLHVLPIRVPSLAERREDIAGLVAHFCARAVEAHQLPRLEVSPSASRAVEEAEWPGNVRQLENAVMAAAIRAAGEGVLQIEIPHFFPERGGGDASGGEVAGDHGSSAGHLTFQEATRRFQRQLVSGVLSEVSWNVTEAANRLDLTRSHVYNLIRAFGLERQ